MIRSALMLQRFMADPEDLEAADWLRARLASWRQSAGRQTFAQAFGISDNSLTVARELRDHWLREAAKELPAQGRARLLLRALQLFEPTLAGWGQEGLPERDPDPFAWALYLAMRSGAPLTLSEKQLGRILDMADENVSGPVCNDDSNKPEDRDDGLPPDATEFRAANAQPDDPRKPETATADRPIEPRGGAVQPGARDRKRAARPDARRARGRG